MNSEHIRNETSRFLLLGGKIKHLPDQVAKRGLTAIPKHSDKDNEETDSIDWLSDAINPGVEPG